MLTKQEIYKIYKFKPTTKALTAFQNKFYKTQLLRKYYKIPSKFILSSTLYTVQNLEKRLDIVICRMNLVTSLLESRQKISHGKVFVNGEKIRSNNYQLKSGARIEVKGIRNIPVKVLSSTLSIPNNMIVNYEIGSGVYLREGKIEEILTPI